MKDDETVRKDVEDTMSQLEVLAEQPDSKANKRLILRGLRRLVERIARHEEQVREDEQD